MYSNLDCVSLHRGYVAITGFAVVALGLKRVVFDLHRNSSISLRYIEATSGLFDDRGPLVTSMYSNLDCVSLHRGYIAITGFAVVALGLKRIVFQQITNPAPLP